MGDSGSPPERIPWIEEVRARLEAHRRAETAAPEGSRRAAVLVPLFVRNGALWILLTRRTDTLEHHRGQIAFPGGAEEEGDDSLLATALRETEEEIGVAGDAVVPLGTLPTLTTVTDFYVAPFVGAIPHPYPFRPAESEIAELIEVPLRSLYDPGIREERLLPGRTEPTLFYHSGPHVIWGATARILADLLEALH
jgi:8-oxo-dGTP pyrophosphatase MutT (NUDIX family)